jgi:hypothetical protein
MKMEDFMATSPANLRARSETGVSPPAFRVRAPLPEPRYGDRRPAADLAAFANRFRYPRSTRWQRDRAFRRSLP